MQKPDTLRRMVKQAVKLGEFDIQYMPKLTIWAQALADFVVEYYKKKVLSETKEELDTWEFYANGSLIKKGSGTRLILAKPEE